MRRVMLLAIGFWCIAMIFDSLMDVINFNPDNLIFSGEFWRIKSGFFPAFLYDGWHLSKIIMQAIIATAFNILLKLTIGSEYKLKHWMYFYVGFGCATYIVHELFTHLILIN